MPGQSKTVDIDTMIADLPRKEQVIVKRLRALVMECIPQATEKAYYDLAIPFYAKNRLICFIWPPSISWGTSNDEKRRLKGVTLGFNQGNRMSNDDGVLLAEGRKQVYVMYIKEPAEINEIQIRALLYEAALIDETFAKRRKKK